MSRPQQTVARGFLLPAAIFLLVILAALGAFILNISTSQHLGMALDMKGERVWQAANAGMEWARYRLAESNNANYPPSGTGLGATCPAGTTWGSSGYSLGFSNSSTLKDSFATVECRQVANTDVQGIPTWVFELRVTACSPAAVSEPRCPGTPTATGYAERQLQGLVSF